MRMVGLAALLLGCAGDDSGTSDDSGTDTDTPGPVDCLSQDMGLTLGWGLTTYTPLTESDDMVIVHGPQGGWHIEVAGELVNSGQEVSILPRFTVVGTGEQIAGDQQEAYTALASYDDLGCSGQFFGIRAFVDDFDSGGMTNQQYICGLDGQQVEMCITIGDLSNGRTVEECIVVTTRNDELDRTSNCP